MQRKGFQLPSFSQLAVDYPRWRKILKDRKTSVDMQLPWMTFSAIRFMEKHLDKSMKVFEFGSGGSSLFLSARAGEVVSVEHDKQWFELLEQKMKAAGFTNWKGAFVEPELSDKPAKSAADPNEYGTDSKEFSLHRFKAYASYIDQFPDELFQWVLVDGRARPSCIAHSVSKVKMNGFLLLDNSDREYYLVNLPENFFKKFRVVCDAAGPTPFLDEFTKTTIWQKFA